MSTLLYIFYINDRKWSLNFNCHNGSSGDSEDVKEQSLHGAVAKRTLGLLRQPHYLLHPLTEEKKINDNSSGDKLDEVIYSSPPI